jgi:hypothetical protein
VSVEIGILWPASDEVEIQAPSGAWRARILSIGR